VNVDLGNEGAGNVGILKFLGSDVLALAQLEDVLRPVNDLKRSIGVNHAHIS
jgi:hypothetical protein